MKVTCATIPDVLVIQPTVFCDSRGFVYESFSQKKFNDATGLNINFVQDNHSRSSQGVLRGLHYQVQHPQGKLICVVRGVIFDVVVDVRASSPTFGQWLGMELTEYSHRQLWIPPGFAHGFLVLSESADVLYKTTDYYLPSDEACLAWDDPVIGIQWPLRTRPILSARDIQGGTLGSVY
jgi:dTDP-4-dehydrorhamnose 3,5-epimerase